MAYRLERVESLVHQEIAEILSQEIDFRGQFVTVTRVSVSPDIQHAAVFLSILPSSARADALRRIQKSIGHIQEILNKRLRMRPVPRLHFAEDIIGARFEEVDRALKKIRETKPAHDPRRRTRKTRSRA